MNREFIDFVLSHEGDDTTRLLLGATRHPGIDMPLAAQQIEGRRTAREKWPSLLETDEFLYPPRLNREQASSEATAGVKREVARRLLGEGFTAADLTGGMGIDSIALAREGGAVDYVERDEALCALARHNSRALGLGNLHVHHADSMEWLRANDRHFDLLYLDPARRDACGRKVAAFEECTPDLSAHLPLLLARSRRLMVKASPMIDLDLAARQLGGADEMHVVSVQGECKEVLFVCGGGGGMQIVIHSLRSSGSATATFTRAEEATASPRYCTAVSRHLYEPDAALMKAGPFRLICQWWDMPMLAPNTHLYTSDARMEDFPGRVFEVMKEVPLDPKAVKEALPDGRAHVMVRNFPVPAADLQRRLGLAEGGELFLVATTLGSRRLGLLCHRIA